MAGAFAMVRAMSDELTVILTTIVVLLLAPFLLALQHIFI